MSGQTADGDPMIDYDDLCQAIGAHKAGKRPSAPPPLSQRGAESVEEVDAGLVMLDDASDSAYLEETGAYRSEDFEALKSDAFEVSESEVDFAGADEGWQRDPELEAQDDWAQFDLDNDLPRWFQAARQIESAWDAPDARRRLIREYGIEDEPHFFQVRATVERYLASGHGQRRWGDEAAIHQLRVRASQDPASAHMGEQSDGELTRTFEAATVPGSNDDGDPPLPFDRFVEIVVAQRELVAQGFDANAVIEEFGLTHAEWHTVNTWWNEHLNHHMMDNDQALLRRYNQLQAEFEAKYRSDA